MSERTYDAAIAGGGFAGMVTAAALARAGLDVVVVEPRMSAEPRALRGELLHPLACRALEDLGFSDALCAAGAVDVAGFVAYADTSPSPFLLDYGARGGLALEHGALVGALRQVLESRPGARFIADKAIDVIWRGQQVAGLRLASGETLSSRLVVVADGRHSKLRSILGLEAEAKLVSHTFGATIDAAALPHHDRGHVFLGGPGPVLAYPIGPGRARVNVDVPLEAPRGRRALVDYIRRAYATAVPPELFEVSNAAFDEQPLVAAANLDTTTRSCVVDGAVLVGDAGGCSHPLTATGMTCAVHDALTLASAIRRAGPTPRALASYQRQRYRFVRAREAFSRAFYQLSLGDDAGARALRDGLMRYWEDPRSRDVSMAILSAEESRARAFAAQYFRVVGAATHVALGRARHDRSLDQPAALARGVGVAARNTFAMMKERTRTVAHPRHALALAAPLRQLLALDGEQR